MPSQAVATCDCQPMWVLSHMGGHHPRYSVVSICALALAMWTVPEQGLGLSVGPGLPVWTLEGREWWSGVASPQLFVETSAVGWQSKSGGKHCRSACFGVGSCSPQLLISSVDHHRDRELCQNNPCRHCCVWWKTCCLSASLLLPLGPGSCQVLLRWSHRHHLAETLRAMEGQRHYPPPSCLCGFGSTCSKCPACPVESCQHSWQR